MGALGLRNAEVAQLRSLLRDPRRRRELGATVIEGPRVLDAALDRDAAIDTVYVAPTARDAFPALLQRVAERDLRVVDLRDGVVDRISTTVTPQPILALVTVEAWKVEDLLARAGFVLVGLELQDPGNVGAILRSLEATAAAGLLLSGDSVDPLHPKVVRASAGARFGVPVAVVTDPAALPALLHETGRQVYGASMTGTTRYDQADLTGSVAVVVGNEGRGLPSHLAASLDGSLVIPMAAPVESLNVAVAASVLVFEAARQTRTRRSTTGDLPA